jgi:hypothetical protein
LKILFSVPRSAASSTISPEIKASSGWALLIMSPSNHSDQCASTWPVTRMA